MLFLTPVTHTAMAPMDALMELFGTRIISNDLWLAWLSNINHLFVGNPKTKMYRSNVYTIEEMAENLWREIFSVSQEELQCMNVNSLQRCLEFMWNNGRAFSISTLIWKKFYL
jgi:hypothetical protein